MKQVPDDKGEIRLRLQTDLLTSFLRRRITCWSSIRVGEAIYVLDGEATLNYMDRGWY